METQTVVQKSGPPAVMLILSVGSEAKATCAQILHLALLLPHLASPGTATGPPDVTFLAMTCGMPGQKLLNNAVKSVQTQFSAPILHGPVLKAQWIILPFSCAWPIFEI